MLKEIEDRYPHDSSRIEAPIAASEAPMPAAPIPAVPIPAAPKVPVQAAAADANRWPKAQAVVIPATEPSPPRRAVASNPFFR
jgi:hypothetical protein